MTYELFAIYRATKDVATKTRKYKRSIWVAECRNGDKVVRIESSSCANLIKQLRSKYPGLQGFAIVLPSANQIIVESSDLTTLRDTLEGISTRKSSPIAVNGLAYNEV